MLNSLYPDTLQFPPPLEAVQKRKQKSSLDLRSHTLAHQPGKTKEKAKTDNGEKT